MHPMIFYEAHGGPNACGPNCSEWIAAEGKIAIDTVERLAHLLAQLHGTRPPIFFHSPGGSVTGSITLGRFIREKKMTVSISHTIALNCDRDPAKQNSCAAQIAAHHRVEAELDTQTAMCNSACGYALAGGAVRQIPPWVTLGIHDIAIDPAAPIHPSALTTALAEKETGIRLRNYLREMGIGPGLVDEAFAIPHTMVARLSRDDAARFGLDRRQFAESMWQFLDRPVPAVRKYFFLRTTTDQPHYINGFVNLSCAKGTNFYYVLAYGREQLGSDSSTPASAPPIDVSLNERQFRFYRQTNQKYYVRSARLAPAVLDQMTDNGTIALPGAEFGRGQGPSGDATLSMLGFSAMFAKLRTACAQAAAGAQTASLTQPGSTIPPQMARPIAPDGAQVLARPLVTSQLKPGVKRSLVDATIGAPTKTIGTTALYRYTSSDNETKVMSGYFDASGRLQRFARYVLKDGKVVDEISSAELSEGQELSAIRALLVNNAATESATTSQPAVSPK